MSMQPHEDAVSERLGRLGAPRIDPALRDRTLRAARAELRLPGEGTLSLRGLGFAWEDALAPAVLLLAGAGHAVGAAVRIATLFLG